MLIEDGWMKNGLVRVRTAKESFLLLNPKVGMNSHEVAKAIASCKGVNKVFVSSGEYGFVAFAPNNEKLKHIERSIKRMSLGKIKTIKNYYVYQSAKAIT